MNLLEYFSSINKPTESQKEALRQLDSFLCSTDRCFILKGYAGTGKTYIIQSLCRYLGMLNVSFKIMAPTGRAAKVIRERSGYDSSTIHKAIYSLDELKSKEERKSDNSVEIKYYFDLKPNGDNSDTVYIIDEASMVSNVYSEGEFFKFGTGYLLKDLLQYIGLENKNNRRKVIFIGDNAQLPPVGSNLSPALSSEYINENYNLKCEETELTEVVRQSSGSGILSNATKLRNQIKIKQYNKIDISTEHEDIEKIGVDSFLSKYLESTNNHIDINTIIVGYSNEKVYRYNKVIREHFFSGTSNITKGDRVMVVQNNYSYDMELFNGDFATVMWASPSNEIRHIPLKVDKREIVVELVFRDVILRFSDNKGGFYDIRCKIFENILNSKEREITPEETRALYVDFLIRNRNLRTGSEEFKLRIRKDPYFNSIRLKYGYAITCHKAQGGEWKNVFVDFNMGKNVLCEEYFRWAYTAITRSKQKLYTIAEPHISLITGLTDNMDYKESAIKDAVSAEMDGQVIELIRKFNLTEKDGMLVGLLSAVHSRLKTSNISIVDIKHMQYCERYFLSFQGNICWVQFWYNKSNVISNFAVQTDAEPKIIKELQRLLGDLIKKEVAVTEEKEDPAEDCMNFDGKPDFLKEFYLKLSESVKQKGIKVDDITHHNFLEKYRFVKGSFYATVDFYYNSKGQFTSAKPQTAKCNSQELVSEIVNAIKISN